MKKTSILLLSLALTWANAKAQSNRDPYQAYLSGLASLWESSVVHLQQAYKKSNSPEDLFQLAVAQYGLLNNTMKDSDEGMFDKYVDPSVENLEKLIDIGYRRAESKAMLSAITGFKIAYSSWKGMFLGAKAGSLIDEAVKESPNAPLVRKLYANYLYFTPEMFGGDKAKAVSEYQKSTELFEKENVAGNWLYLDTMAWLGISLSNQDKKVDARSVYEKALSIEPDFNWVKYGLLPGVQ